MMPSRGKPWLVFPAIVFAAIPFAQELPAQEAMPVTTRDSAEIRIAAMRRLLRGIGSEQQDLRIWLRFRAGPTPRSRGEQPSRVSPAQWAVIAEAYPEARFITTRDTLFACPSGARVMMPLSGCPIREDGVIIDLAPPQVHGDSVWISGTLTRSSPSHRGHHTWAAGSEMLFERGETAWRFRRYGLQWTT